MRAFLPSYEMVAPRSLDDALQKLAADPGLWRPFAGGTDLMVLFEAGKLEHRKYISLWNLPELQGIREEPANIIIGALATYSRIQTNPRIQAEFPMLVSAAAETGAIAIQNRGTLGGNIANASPAADSPPALLAYGAELEIMSTAGMRLIPYSSFHRGYKQMDLNPGEVIRAVRLPRAAAMPTASAPKLSAQSQRVHFYRKVGTRKAQAISKVCLAATAMPDSGTLREVRIAVGSVAPVPFRCVKTEALLEGRPPSPALIRQARESLQFEITPIDDIRSTSGYRSIVAANLLQEFIESCGTGSRS